MYLQCDDDIVRLCSTYLSLTHSVEAYPCVPTAPNLAQTAL